MRSTATDDPEILLCASDDDTMQQWLEAIAQESMRTDDFVAPDWWTETFGSVSSIAYSYVVTTSSSLLLNYTVVRFL